MAAPSLTYTLTNGQTADASQVMQNFSDLLNGITDGTKDLSISALTCAGITTLNGNVIIGNASSDDLTVTGSLASSIPIKTTRSYDIGSADLGLRTIYLGGNSTHTVALSAPSSGYSGDVTFSLPVSNGTSNYVLITDGSGVTSWAALETAVAALTMANLSNADATKIGHKVYYHGTSYNGGNTPTITLTAGGGTLSSVEGTQFVLKQMQDIWYITFCARMTVSGTTRTTATFNISGLTFKNSVNYTIVGGVAGAINNECTVVSNTGNFIFNHASASTDRYHATAPWIPLESKPTWAY